MDPVPTSPKYRVTFPEKHKKDSATEERHRTLFFAFLIAVFMGLGTGLTGYMVGRAYFPEPTVSDFIRDVRRPVSSPIVLTDDVQQHVDFAMVSVVSPEVGENGYVSEDIVSEGVMVSDDGLAMIPGQYEEGKQVRVLLGDGSVSTGTIKTFDPLTNVSFISIDSRVVVPVSGVAEGSLEPGDRVFGVHRVPGVGLTWESGFVLQNEGPAGEVSDSEWPTTTTTTLSGENVSVFAQDGGFVGFSHNGALTSYDVLNGAIGLALANDEIERYEIGISYISLEYVVGLEEGAFDNIQFGAKVTESLNQEIEVGDVIIQVNEEDVTADQPPHVLFAKASTSETAEVLIIRQNRELPLTIELATR